MRESGATVAAYATVREDAVESAAHFGDPTATLLDASQITILPQLLLARTYLSPSDQLSADITTLKTFSSNPSLAKALQAKTGKPLAELAQSDLFAPLGLKQTTYAASSAGRVMMPYPGPAAPSTPPFITTAPELARLIAEFTLALNGRSQIISQAVAQAVATDLSVNGAIRIEGAFVQVHIQPYEGLAAVSAANRSTPALLDRAFASATTLRRSDMAASFEPAHVSGDYAGGNICPVCEYAALPLVISFINNESDEEIIALAKSLEQTVVDLGRDDIKAFIILPVFSAPSASPAERQAAVTVVTDRATRLAQTANVQNVALCVLPNPEAGTYRNYAINRTDSNVTYLLRNRSVVSARPNQPLQPASLAELDRAVRALFASR